MRTTASITDFTENVTSKAARNKDWYCEQGIKQQRLIWHRGMDTEFEWQKKWRGCFQLNSMSWISVHRFFFLLLFLFFPQLFTRLKRSSSFRGKMIQKWSEGKQKLLSSFPTMFTYVNILYSVNKELNWIKNWIRLQTLISLN